MSERKHIQHYRTATKGNTPNPANLWEGEIAINMAKDSEALFIKNDNGEIIKIEPNNIGLVDSDASLEQVDLSVVRLPWSNEIQIENNIHYIIEGLTSGDTEFIFVNEINKEQNAVIQVTLLVGNGLPSISFLSSASDKIIWENGIAPIFDTNHYVKMMFRIGTDNEWLGSYKTYPLYSDNELENMNKYLSITALEDDFSLTFDNGGESFSLYYSIDYGNTWERLSNNAPTPKIQTYETIMFKGNNRMFGVITPLGNFSITQKCKLHGNCTALINGDDNYSDLIGYTTFGGLFKDCTGIIEVSETFLPATSFKESCYEGMFQGCTSLVVAPKLPATTLADSCYASMFQGCTSLVNAPELPATTLTSDCYNGMFHDCTSLVNAPELPATELDSSCYSSMFQGCTSLVTAPVLPATELTSYCYQSMFQGCTSLVNAPELPATALAYYCYSYMFKGCTLLVTAPALPATALADSCYEGMFYSCTSLVNAPELPATELGRECYNSMFAYCTSLVNAPVLPATELADICYQSMFRNCTSLITAPELPATALAYYCYYNMFINCTSLVNAPELPATALADSCYAGMFNGCTSLVTAPELPATALVMGCYTHMFQGCSKLNYVKAMFTTEPSTKYTNYWLDGVSNRGTFVKNPYATWEKANYYGTPLNWDVNYGDDYLIIRAVTDIQVTFNLNDKAVRVFEKSGSNINKGDTFTVAANNNLIVFGNLIPTSSGIGNISVKGTFDLYGNCMALLFGSPNGVSQSNSLEGYNYAFKDLFKGNSGLRNIYKNFLPATTLSEYCYSGMFQGCLSLTNTPELPAMELTPYCYQSMFKGSSITGVTNGVLSATTLANNCYQSMFEDCKSLQSITIGANTMVDSCFYAMFKNSGISGVRMTINNTAPYCCYEMFMGSAIRSGHYLDVQSLAESCFEGMYKNCTKLTSMSPINAQHFSQYCCYEMFSGCVKITRLAIAEITGTAPYSFYGMYKNCTSLNSPLTISNEEIAPYSFAYMFEGCTSLTSHFNNLVIKSLGEYAFCGMYKNCTSLNIEYTPKMSVENIPNGCFREMYMGCSNLKSGSTLFIDNISLGDNCCEAMYSGCTSLVNVVNMVSNDIGRECYKDMFADCTSLTSMPELHPFILTNGCYKGMFKNCTSLTGTTALHSTMLAENCYESMFEGCTSLVAAPELPETTLVSGCYNNMFAGCSNLNYINASFLTEPSDEYTYNWVNGVSETGTFVKNADATWNVTGVNGIPEGWEIEVGSSDNGNYLTIQAIDNGMTVSFSKDIEYSIDNGYSWSTLSANTSSSEINIGGKIMFKGNLVPSEDIGIGNFTINGRCNLMGNCMSLLFGDDAANHNSLEGYDKAFCKLFNGCTGIVEVSNNFLPATTLADSCYMGMFQGCTSLVNAPELPATELTNGCYSYMFHGCTSLVNAPELPVTTLAKECYLTMFYRCTSLVNAPELPATELADGCYTAMFYGCTSLVNAPELPATELAKECYYYMFHGCTSLVNAPELPATTLADKCYQGMFYSCTSLVNAPELPATTLSTNCYMYMFYDCRNLRKAPVLPTTTLADNCYKWMFGNCTSLVNVPELPATTLAPFCYAELFQGCTSLVNAPELPATTLANGCYKQMFMDCTSLTKAPKLPATELVSQCYGYMFYRCNNINYIDASFLTEPSATAYTEQWLDGVSSTGTFVKNANATWDVTGVNGVPEGWNILHDRLSMDCNYLGVHALDSNLNISFSNDISYSIDNGETWNVLPSNTEATIGFDETILFKGNLTPVDYSGIGTFTINNRCNLFGNILSLLHGDNASEMSGETLPTYSFMNLFRNCSGIIEVSDNLLPSTKISEGAYLGMFRNCTSLINMPELPATNIGRESYASMFAGCTSLKNATAIKATSLGTSCCEYMFEGCSSLKTAPQINATSTASKCFRGMFYNCSSLVNAPILAANYIAGYCYEKMFEGCTSLVTAPELPATTLANNCYSDMFANCQMLKNAPELPATTLSTNCYMYMFYGCRNLRKAPVLPATTLVSGCYMGMFQDCSELNYVKALFTTTPSSDYTGYWLYGTSERGLFIKSYDATWNVTGINGIPEGWHVEVDGDPNGGNYLTVEALEDDFSLTFNGNNIEYSTDSGVTWMTLYDGTPTEYVNSGETIMFKASGLTPEDYVGIGSFSITKQCNLKGNCMSMLFGDDAANHNSLEGYDKAFCKLFNGCTGIVEVSNNFLPATTLADDCYRGMFAGCTSLVTAPELPATTLGQNCYSGMFSYCTSLVNAPALPATELDANCYGGMFYGCTSLITAPELPATELIGYCYRNMFQGCSNLNYVKALFTTTPSGAYTSYWLDGVSSTGTFVKNANATWDVTGVDGVPEGWTVETV